MSTSVGIHVEYCKILHIDMWIFPFSFLPLEIRLYFIIEKFVNDSQMSQYEPAQQRTEIELEPIR